MENSKLKNMVVLKNLPSNIVEEAFVVLKSSKKVKKLQKIEKNRKAETTKNIRKDKDYLLKEAEMLVSSYISKLENNEQKVEPKTIGTMKKYKKMRSYAFFATVMIVLETIILIVR